MALGVEGNCLVARVEAGHVALAAVHAEIVVYHWEFLLFRHMVDVFEVVIASSSDILQSRHLGDVNLSWLLSLSPEIKVINEFF